MVCTRTNRRRRNLRCADSRFRTGYGAPHSEYYAHGVWRNHREITVNPLATLPHKTTFHEVAHDVLGHTSSEKLVDGELTSRHLCEVEAESVALFFCETLGLDGAEFCRGYIQHWSKTVKEIPNHNA